MTNDEIITNIKKYNTSSVIAFLLRFNDTLIKLIALIRIIAELIANEKIQNEFKGVTNDVKLIGKAHND